MPLESSWSTIGDLVRSVRQKIQHLGKSLGIVHSSSEATARDELKAIAKEHGDPNPPVPEEHPENRQRSPDSATTNGNAGEHTEPQSFMDRMRSNEPQPEDADIAAMANAAYAPDEQFGLKLPSGIRRFTDEEKRNIGLDPRDLNHESGFYAELFHAQSKEGENYTVLAIRGTDTDRFIPALKDWGTNAIQAAGIHSGAYEHAAQVAKKVQESGIENLVIAGHSLGGGEADIAGLATGCPVVTFNAAGPSDPTIEWTVAQSNDPTIRGMTLDEAKTNAFGRTRAYFIGTPGEKANENWEPLSRFQDDLPIPKALGRPIPLTNTVKKLDDSDKLDPAKILEREVAMHNMPNVIEAINKDQPWKSNSPGTAD